MMSVAWRKVWHDLWSNKLRTLLVVLATTTGVFAVGLVIGLSDTMTVRMTESHLASVPPHLRFETGWFDQATVDAMQSEPGVADTEGEFGTYLRWKLEGETDWRDGILMARDDYEAQHMFLIGLLDGNWPGRRTLAVERLSADYFNLPIGTRIVVKVGQREHSLPIEGVVRHPHTPPPQLGESGGTFIATMKTAAWLTDQEEEFNMLNVRLESFSLEAAEKIGKRIDDRLERLGVRANQATESDQEEHGVNSAGGDVSFWSVMEPDVHWGQDIVDTVSLILAALGVVSLGMSGFLIINTMNAIIVQEVWQIGVMKVVGATFGRVVRIYLAMALVYGLLALLVAVPLAAIATHLLAAQLLDLFNIVLSDFRMSPTAMAVQVVLATTVPLLTALVPVIGSARITPREAISSHGLGGKFGRGWLDQLIGRIRSLPRPLALSLRNTFRRKARVILTLLALTGAGVMFVMVMSLSSSFDNTLDIMFSDFSFDAMVVLDRSYYVKRLTEMVQGVLGVSAAEAWNRQGALLLLPNGEDLSIGVWGVPPNSAVFNPCIVSGHDLPPNEGRVILLNNKIAVDEGFQVGDEIELTIGGRESTWTVVGLVANIQNGSNDNFVPFDALARTTDGVSRAGRLLVTFDERDPEVQQRLTNELVDLYKARRVKIVYSKTASMIREEEQREFSVINYLLLTMTALAALIGSVGLMSTMSINVIERRREIGMMRAIGATSLVILGIFVVEGVLIGVLSWLFAVPLSYPIARLFSEQVGVTMLEFPLDFSYPLSGLGLWLGIVVAVSALASLWPALQATKVSVREALTYE